MTAVAIPLSPLRRRAAPARWGQALLLVVASSLLVLVGGAAWAYWVATATAGSAGAAVATSVNAGATPTASASGANVTVSWSASTLANGMAVAGYEVRRYNSTTLVQQTILSACTGTVAALSCVESAVPNGTWRYTVTPLLGTNWRGAESAMSAVVTVDTIVPINTVSLSSITGGASLAGTTVYYRGAALGSFTVTNAVTDGGSGPASSQTAALGGTTTGWTHTPSTVSTPAGGPYISNAFSWAAATTSSPTEAVVGRDVVGNTATTNLTFVNDSTAPALGTITYLNGNQPGKSASVTFTTGTDGGAGVVTRQLQRAQVAAVSGVCGTPYSAFTNVGPGLPTSPYVDTTVVNSYCYMYQYVVTDAVGNQSITTSTNVSLVDYRGAVAETSGLISRYRLGDASTAGAMDDKGPNDNNGTFFNTPTGGVTGALPNDADKAVLFDGVNDYATATRQISGDFSIEFWFKTSQYAGFGCDQWWRGHGLVDAELNGGFQDFGVSLCAGRIVAGVGTPDVSIVSAPDLHDNQWHYVVFTRTQSTGALALYIDGVLSGTATANTNPLNASATLTFGRQATGIQYYSGVLDEVALYTSVLSPTTVTNHYQLGSSVATDTSGPTGGSVDATGLVGTGTRYSTSPNLSIVFTPGTDPSGLLTAGRTLLRATATLTAGTCGTFGAYALVTGGTDPASPKADTVTTGACYRYQYTVSDTLGNTTTYTSGDIKVDSTAPSTPTLAISALTNSYWSGSGTTVYYNSGSATGSFTVTGSSTDAESGVLSYTFPAAGTNWSSTPGALGVNTYSWSGAPAAPGTKNITSTNNAATASANSPLTFTADNTAPSAGTITYPDGAHNGSTVTVTFTTGTDAGSGIATRLLQRATATVAGSVCGTFGAFATVTGGTNPTSPFVDTISETGTCYMYRYVVTDNVGNQTIATSANKTRPAGAIWAFNEGTGTTAADTSGNGNPLTLQAAAGWTTGRVGPYALNLNGTATSWAGHGYRVINTTQSHTVMAWVKLVNYGGAQQTFAAVDGAFTSPFFLQTSGAGAFRFGQAGSDVAAPTFTAIDGGAPVNGQWYHVTGVYNQTAGTLELYVNGVSMGTTPAFTPFSAFGTTSIGRAKFNGANTDFVNGALDDVRFYGRVLTPTEILNIASPGAIWTFNEGTGTTAADTAGSGSNATLQAGAGWTTGRVGPSALNLTGGTTSWASYAYPTVDTTRSFTWASWVKLNNTTGYQTVLAIDGNQVSPFYIQTNGSGAFRFAQSSADIAAPAFVVSQGGAPVAGTWYHLAGVYNKTAGTIELYINGVSQGTAVAFTPWSATGATTIGRTKWTGVNNDFLNGAIDDVRMYNRVLTPAEIAALAAM